MSDPRPPERRFRLTCFTRANGGTVIGILLGAKSDVGYTVEVLRVELRDV